MQFKCKTVLFQAIQFIINTQFSFVWTIDRVLSSATILGLSGPGSDGNERGSLQIYQDTRWGSLTLFRDTPVYHTAEAELAKTGNWINCYKKNFEQDDQLMTTFWFIFERDLLVNHHSTSDNLSLNLCTLNDGGEYVEVSCILCGRWWRIRRDDGDEYFNARKHETQTISRIFEP